MKISDEITFAAVRGFNKRQGYSQLERMRAALETALPYLAPAGEPLDFDSVELRDAVGAEVFRGLHGNGTVHFDTDVENNAMRDWTNYFVKSTLRALKAIAPSAPAEPEYNATHPVGRRSVPGIHHAEDCPMRVGLVTTGCVCGREGEREPAPAGDGGLREALEEAARLIDTYLNSTALQDSGLTIAEALRDEGLLAAHPAAHAVSTDTAESTASTSAVPLPVDREALTALVDGAEHYDTCFKMLTPVTNNVCTCLLADLRALLAGGGQS